MNTSNTTPVLLNMTKLGLNTLVHTTKEEIDWYLNEFATQPDSRFGGVGKKKFLEYLSQQLPLEDEYFSKYLVAQIVEPERWQDFMTDCVIYACFHFYLNHTLLPVETAHSPLSNAAQAIRVLKNVQ